MAVGQEAAVDGGFERSRSLFAELSTWMASDEALALPLGEVEAQLLTRGEELMRQLVQDHDDLFAMQEGQAVGGEVLDADGSGAPPRGEGLGA